MFLESFNDKDHKKQCRYEIPMYKNADANWSIFSLRYARGAVLSPPACIAKNLFSSRLPLYVCSLG